MFSILTNHITVSNATGSLVPGLINFTTVECVSLIPAAVYQLVSGVIQFLAVSVG